MFVAMNRFKVVRGEEAAFEAVWKGRDSKLHEMPGFLDFRLLRGPEKDDHTLYCSHSMWADKDSFLAWTKSEQFRHAHRDAGSAKPLYLAAPEFEGYETVEGA
jgi:heme-degrading monooxygenase HmoA